jgi:hypothetical protein
MVLSEQESLSLLRRLVSLPRRTLLGMKQRELRPVAGVAADTLTEFYNRQNGYGVEPDEDLYGRASEATEFSLMERAVSRQRIESEGRANFPGRPKPAARGKGKRMSQARGARN